MTMEMIDRPGVVEPIDLWAIRYAHMFRDHKKWLADFSRLKISKYIDISKRHDFLEIGPQTGWRTLSSLAFSGQNVTAIDNWSYRRAWRFFGSRVKFIISDADKKLPLEDQSFDHCVFMAAISYLSDPSGALKEICRVLRKGGYLFLSCNAKNSYVHEHNMLDPVMRTLWDERDINEKVREAGFDITEVFRYDYPVLSSADKAIYNVQKFFALPRIYESYIRRYPGKENYVACIARKR